MGSLVRDFRYAVRMLAKNGGFTAVAALTLALGIGANTAVFSVVNAVLLKALPYRQPDRLMILHETSPKFDASSMAYLNLVDWQQHNRSFENIAGYRHWEFNFTGAGDPERLPGLMVSAGFFRGLGVRLRMGREFLAEEDRPGGAPVAVLSERLWQRRFGGDPRILGRGLTLNGKRYTIVGIAPSKFWFFGQADEVWLPLGQYDSPEMKQREFHPGIYAVARLKPGVTPAQAREDLQGIARQLSREYPSSNHEAGAGLVPMKQRVVGDAGKTLWILLGAVAFVLLIACANVANLLLARASARRKEMAVRAAVGAGRFSIIRQLVVESLALSLVAGVLGLIIAAWGTDFALHALPENLPRAGDVHIDGGVLAFTFGVSLLTGILFGLAPAFHVAGGGPAEALKLAGRTMGDPRHGLRNALVVADIALSLVLLAGAGLMIRSVLNLKNVDPGFHARDVLTFQVALSPTRSANAQGTREGFRLLHDRIRNIPGVQAVAINSDLPLGGDDSEVPLSIVGGPRPASQSEMTWAIFYPVTPGYLKAMGIPLLRGRFFDERDTLAGRQVAVIDETMARAAFPREDPIGKVLRMEGAGVDATREIVGVVGHVKHWSLAGDATATVRYQFYMPFAQVPDAFVPLFATGTTFIVRTSVSPAAVAAAVRAQVTGSDRNQPVYNVRTMEAIVAESIARQRFSMWLLTAFAGIALVLATVGVYGLTSYSVSRRTQEIGLRMALGAHRDDVLRMVLGQGARPVLLGAAIGVAAALLATRAMSALLYGVGPSDPWTLFAVVTALVTAALAASYIPARRAANADPMRALRYE